MGWGGNGWLRCVPSLFLSSSPLCLFSAEGKTDGAPCSGRKGTQGLAIGCTPTTRWSGRRRRGGRWSRGHVNRRGGPHGGAGGDCRRGRRRGRWRNWWKEEHVRGRLLVLATKRSTFPLHRFSYLLSTRSSFFLAPHAPCYVAPPNPCQKFEECRREHGKKRGLGGFTRRRGELFE